LAVENGAIHLIEGISPFDDSIPKKSVWKSEVSMYKKKRHLLGQAYHKYTAIVSEDDIIIRNQDNDVSDFFYRVL
jgi:hypothetical protein